MGDTELYIHEGGYLSLWAIGLMHVFRSLEDSVAMTIHVLHGFSIGAILVVLYVCKLTTHQGIEAYYLLQEHVHGSGLY